MFAGTWNALSLLTYKISTNAPATGITIMGSVVAVAATSAATSSGDPLLSTAGISAGFVTATTPFTATLTTQITAVATTTLAVTALPFALASGATVLVTYLGATFTAVTSAAVAVSATSIPISSATPTQTFPVGSGVSAGAGSGGGTLYAQALRSQIQTTTAAGPGDIGATTITASWTES